MERIVYVDRDAVRADFRRPNFPHEWRDYPSTKPGEVVERLRDATVAITNKTSLREAELVQLPHLRLIAVSATGVDRIDLDFCRRRGITVCNVPRYAESSVPEHALMLMLALRRNLIAYREAVRDGAWQRATQFCVLDFPISDLAQSTLGVIGYGTLGQAVAKLAAACGMRVLIAEHKGAATVRPGRVGFDELLAQSDIVTLHCPLTDETRGLIGHAELAKMPRHALLINCARGGVVDEAALLEALRAGQIAGAGVDVLTAEPPRDGHALLDADLPNLIVTPHVAWASAAAMQKLADVVVENIEAFVNGAPQNTVT